MNRIRSLGFASALALAATWGPRMAHATMVQFDPNYNGVVCTSGCGAPTPFAPTGNASLSVSTSSSRVALGSASATTIITNTGGVAISVKLGNSSVTAATTDTLIQPGTAWVFATGSNTYVAAITASGTSALVASTGTGSPQIAGGGVFSGSVTVADGADAALGAKADAASCATAATLMACLRQVDADVKGVGQVSIVPATHVSTASLAANLVVTGSAGSLKSIDVAADSTLYANDWWIIILNATSPPADGGVQPAFCLPLTAGTRGFAGALPTPVAFGAGIVISVSTTGCYSKAASTHAFISGDF